jgi:hypothetical protein
MVMLNSGGKWIKVKEVNNGDIITIKTEGTWQENTQYKYSDGNPKQDFVVVVEHIGEDKQMRMNGKNRGTLINAYGQDTAKWVGKTATITKKIVEIAGEDKEVIRLTVDGADQGEATEDTDAPF